jgi:hypothetical protein
MKATLSLFRHLTNDLPPLFPDDKSREVFLILDNPPGSLEELENKMIKIGYTLWPYTKAYQDFLAIAERDMADHFFTPLLPEELQVKYLRYRDQGMVWQNVYSGNSAGYFSLEERVFLLPLLHEVKEKIRQFVKREILSLKREHYLKHVKIYEKKLENIKDKIKELKEMAKKETDHPALSREILVKVRSLEEGLSGLGGEINVLDIDRLSEFFQERRNHLNRMRGIHTQENFDFYAN